jgi:hypothetical protein
MVLVFGMTVVKVEAQSNKGGEFTLINIPSKYDGKYIHLGGRDDDIMLGGSEKPPQEISSISQMASRIINGKAVIPLWFSRDGKKFERYSGNHSLELYITIYDSDFSKLESVNFEEEPIIRRGEVIDIRDNRVNFSNGSATKSYNDRSKN